MNKLKIFILIISITFTLYVFYSIKQNLDYFDKSNQEITIIKQSLTQEKLEISKLVEKTHILSTEINSKQLELDKYKSNHMIKSYNAEIEGFNLLVNTYESTNTIYKSKLDEYNKKIIEVNKLIQNLDSVKFILPFFNKSIEIKL